MNVEFCNSKAFLIDSTDLKEKVFVACESIFGFKNNSFKRGNFPGPQPVAIESKDIDKLRLGYMVCEKTDGSRAILLLININNKPMCFIINRNNELYFLDLSFKKEVFEGSIFDGEIIKTKSGEWNFLIHDCMTYNGKSFLNENHRLRYNCGLDLILKRYSSKPGDCLNIKTKLFYKFGEGIEETWKHIKSTTENEIDGLIFTPITHSIIFGRDNNLFKWKEIHTLDLKVKFEKKSVYLYYTSKNNLVEFKKYKNDHINYKNIVNFIKKEKILDEEPIIEFKMPLEEHFIPYRNRSDKSHPNGEVTVKNTIINISENLKISDLYRLQPGASADSAAATLTELSLADAS